MTAFEPYGAARNSGEQVEHPAAFLKKKAPQLYKWLLELFRHDGDIDAHIVVRDQTAVEGWWRHFSISIWGHAHEYVLGVALPTGKMVVRRIRWRNGESISVGPRKTRDAGYLGLGAVCRAPYAGEQRRRGHDLYDGDFNEKTWRAILNDILRDNLVVLQSRRDMVSSGRRKKKRRSPP